MAISNETRSPQIFSLWAVHLDNDTKINVKKEELDKLLE